MVSSDVPSPFSADEVAELARGHGTEFSDGVSAWLEAFAQEPAEAFSAVEPILRSGEYGKDAGVGVRALAARLGIEGRVELARLEIESSEKSKPCLEFLEDIGFQKMDEQVVADLLIAEYERSAQNNERRKHLFDMWTARNPITLSVRQKLVDRMLLPALKAGGKQALEHIKARPQMWARVEGRKKVLKDEFRKVAGGKDTDAHLEKLMRDHGLITTRSKGPLGLFGKEEVDE